MLARGRGGLLASCLGPGFSVKKGGGSDLCVVLTVPLTGCSSLKWTAGPPAGTGDFDSALSQWPRVQLGQLMRMLASVGAFKFGRWLGCRRASHGPAARWRVTSNKVMMLPGPGQPPSGNPEGHGPDSDSASSCSLDSRSPGRPTPQSGIRVTATLFSPGTPSLDSAGPGPGYNGNLNPGTFHRPDFKLADDGARPGVS